MKRRDSLKALTLSTLGLAVVPTAAAVPPTVPTKAFKPGPGRTADELIRDKKLNDETFLTAEEFNTLDILCDIILPADAKSGSATQAGVPDFINFMAKDQAYLQTPIRGGLSWLNNYSTRLFGKRFAQITAKQRIEIVEQIAYPKDFKPEVSQGVSFFSKIRDLTLTGFYTTQMGFKDLGYVGNKPNVWDGVPQEVLDKYGLKYDELYFKEDK